MMGKLDEVRAATAGRLRAAGIDTAALDARLLVCEATGLTHEAVVARGSDALDADAAARLSGYLARRLRHEPVSRIKGVREFYGRDFLIDAHTLDPRPDTETLVSAVLGLAGREGWGGRAVNILDLGTGSGCILLTLLAELPDAQGIGTDISEGALRIAARNARRLGLEARARFTATRWFGGLAGRFDLIVSNPPYIASAEIPGLAREVAAHDPRGALDGGADGLDAYRAIAARAADFLTPGGHLLIEIGAGQAEAVIELFGASGLLVDRESLEFDLAGRPRCILAQSPLREGSDRRGNPKISLENRGIQANFGLAK
jgi:release factor glutamine methyltransferase